MITTLIVGLSLLFAGAMLLAYLLVPAWRRQIEQPKHSFQEQLQRYDAQRMDHHEQQRQNQSTQPPTADGGRTNESL